MFFKKKKARIKELENQIQKKDNELKITNNKLCELRASNTKLKKENILLDEMKFVMADGLIEAGNQLNMEEVKDKNCKEKLFKAVKEEAKRNIKEKKDKTTT